MSIAGELRTTCKEKKELKGETSELKVEMENMKRQMELITAALQAE